MDQRIIVIEADRIDVSQIDVGIGKDGIGVGICHGGHGSFGGGGVDDLGILVQILY